jgi:hypothetical protein
MPTHGKFDLEKEKQMKRTVVAIAACLSLSGLAFAQKPARNISASKHPNLAAAQQLVAQAFQKVNAAQNANEFDLGGHAKKAKELLEQVNNELKLAAETANKGHK